MQWYYVEEKQQRGPVDESEFDALCRSGVISAQTLVWNQTMTDWQPLATVRTADPAGDETQVDPAETQTVDVSYKKLCSECGNAFDDEDLVSYQGRFICAACKPVFLQKIREGVLTGTMEYAGFWIRFAAKIIDSLILWVVNFIVGLVGMGLMALMTTSEAAPIAAVIVNLVVFFLQMAINIGYITWFLGKYAATPGKMAIGLKVVTPENTKISYWRAFGRYFAEILSSLILCIGYIMAGFDDEKRALHDRICSTRVIRK